MLPYQTLEEAQVALGRGVTLSETLWFKYSAKEPHFFLHCHSTLFLYLCYFYSSYSIPLGKEIIVRNVKVIQRSSKKEVLQTFVIAIGQLQIIFYPTINLRYSCSFHLRV
ncbi:Methylsterol monooxygenase 1-1, partial [Mucuna pruriens]